MAYKIGNPFDTEMLHYHRSGHIKRRYTYMFYTCELQYIRTIQGVGTLRSTYNKNLYKYSLVVFRRLVVGGRVKTTEILYPRFN